MATMYIDDRDLTRLAYSGTWIPGGGTRDYGGTATSSTHPGDSFAVSFKGTSITVCGTIDATSIGVVTTYSVDGAPPASVTAPAASNDTFQQPFWTSPTLFLGQQLLVTLAEVNHLDLDPGEGTVWFDYFAAFDPTLGSPTPSRTSSARTSSNNVMVGAIVGGTVGGLLIMLGMVLVFILYLKRRARHRKRQSSESNTSDWTREANVRPYLIKPFIPEPRNAVAARRNKTRTDPIITAPPAVANTLTSPGPGAMARSSSGLHGDSSVALRLSTASPKPVQGPENSGPLQSAPSNAIDAIYTPTVDMPPTYTLT